MLLTHLSSLDMMCRKQRLTFDLCVSAQYFATTMVIVGLSVIATVLVLQYHHHDPDGGHMPRWVSRSCSSSSCSLHCFESVCLHGFYLLLSQL